MSVGIFTSDTVIKNAPMAKLMKALGVSLFAHFEFRSKVDVLDMSLKY